MIKTSIHTCIVAMSAAALALTAVAFPEHRQWALDAGFARFLQKPAPPDVVARAILELLAES